MMYRQICFYSDDQLAEEHLALQQQCSQLELVNRSWQLFHDKQMETLKLQLGNDSSLFDDNLEFEQILQLVLKQLPKDNNENDRHDTGKP
jgi:hypothetical protein